MRQMYRKHTTRGGGAIKGGKHRHPSFKCRRGGQVSSTSILEQQEVESEVKFLYLERSLKKSVWLASYLSVATALREASNCVVSCK